MNKTLLATSSAIALLAALAGSANATIFQYGAVLTGPNENPPNTSPGTGFAFVEYDDVLQRLRVQATFSGLLANTSASHIHGITSPPGNVGVAIPSQSSFPSFPLGVTSGTYDFFFDMNSATTYRTAFINNFGGGTVGGAHTAFVNGLNNGTTYFNIHTSMFPGGEIRGFLRPIPAPGAAALLGMGVLALARRRRSA